MARSWRWSHNCGGRVWVLLVGLFNLGHWWWSISWFRHARSLGRLERCRRRVGLRPFCWAEVRNIPRREFCQFCNFCLAGLAWVQSTSGPRCDYQQFSIGHAPRSARAIGPDTNWTRGLAICLQAKPTFAIGKVLQHRSFAVRAGSIRSPLPPGGLALLGGKQCQTWVPRSLLGVLTGIKKPVGPTSEPGANHGPVRQILRCGVAHGATMDMNQKIFDDLPFCQNPTFKDPPTDEQGWTELAGLPAFIIHTENRDGPKILLRKNKQSWLCFWSHRRPAVRRDGSVFARNHWCVIAHSTASVKRFLSLAGLATAIWDICRRLKIKLKLPWKEGRFDLNESREQRVDVLNWLVLIPCS